MSSNNLSNAILHYVNLSVSELDLLVQKFQKKEFPKKSNLLEAGKVAKEVYYVAQGCLRVYYERDGDDISAFFFTEGMFGGAYDSFISCQPSRHSIEAIEYSQLYAISYEDLQGMFETLPKTNEFVRKILEERFVTLHQLYTAQILDSPQERYFNLQRTNPGLIDRIPQHQLATFLGVTPVSLSRIRNRLSRK
jgi:CRP-like cAMP-binding protein